MKQPNIILLRRVTSIIERDGVRALLESNGIPCITEQRDMISVYGHEMTLSLGGYSSFFDGYKIFVRAEDQIEAERLIEETFGSRDTSPSLPDHPRKFLVSCLFSFTVLPVIGHIAAIYHLVKAFQNNQRIGIGSLVIGLIFWSIIPIFVYYARHEFLIEFHRFPFAFLGF